MCALGCNMPSALPCGKDVSHLIADPLGTAAALTGGHASDPNQQVNTPIAAWQAMHERWEKITALLGGTQTMRELNNLFLPQEPAESDAGYANRLSRSVLYNMFEKTLDAMTGRPFARAVELPNYSDSLIEISKDIDLRGSNLDVFLRPIFKNALAYGHAAIMIDHPKNESGDNTTLAQTRDNNLRPYWVPVDGQSIIGWRGEFESGVYKFTQVRIRETATDYSGKWGVGVVERVRVLYQGYFELYEKDKSDGYWKLVDDGEFTDYKGNRLDVVPLVIINFKPIGHVASLPPMEAVADLNINHWQAYSDYQNIVHVAQVPLLFGSGFAEDQSFEISTSRAITGPDGTQLQYVEHSGKAIEAGRTNVEDIENRAALLGAQVLAKKQGQLTATQKIIETDTETSDLQSMVLIMENGVDTAFEITARWMGEDPKKVVGTSDIFKDFGISNLDAQELNAILNTRTLKQITQATFLREYQRRGVLSDNVDIDLEIALTKNEEPNALDLVDDDTDIDNEDE